MYEFLDPTSPPLSSLSFPVAFVPLSLTASHTLSLLRLLFHLTKDTQDATVFSWLGVFNEGCLYGNKRKYALISNNAEKMTSFL